MGTRTSHKSVAGARSGLTTSAPIGGVTVPKPGATGEWIVPNRGRRAGVSNGLGDVTYRDRRWSFLLGLQNGLSSLCSLWRGGRREKERTAELPLPSSGTYARQVVRGQTGRLIQIM